MDFINCSSRAGALAAVGETRALPGGSYALRRSLNVRHQDWREVHQRDTGFAPDVRLGHLKGLVHTRRGLPAQRLRGLLRLGPDDDYFPHVGAAVLAPVPHVERMYAVIGVAGAVHADVVGVARGL